MAIDLKLIDKLLADYKKPEDIIGEQLGLLKQLTKGIAGARHAGQEMTEYIWLLRSTTQAGNNSEETLRNGKTTSKG